MIVLQNGVYGPVRQDYLPLLILFSGVGEIGSTYSCSESSELEEYADTSPEKKWLKLTIVSGNVIQ
jgi:hypothetical protein